MNISINNRSLAPEVFDSESELQSLIEKNPNLLIHHHESPIIYARREVNLPDAGYLDLLCIDEEGTPIAVEVKLGRNAESRRKVVAQAFDYAADLSELTIDELDDICGGSIEACLSALELEENLWKRCGTNLRAGQLKIIVAVDETNESLNRMVRYINDHSDLDVRLVAISKFNGGEILVPNIIVSGNGQEKVVKKSKLRHGDDRVSEVFEALIRTYNETATFKTTGSAVTYRPVQMQGWNKKIHYEFLRHTKSGEIGVEIHNESSSYAAVSDYLDTLEGTVVRGHTIAVAKRREGSARGRAFIKFDENTAPSVIAEAMMALIEHTKDEIAFSTISNRTAEKFSQSLVPG